MKYDGTHNIQITNCGEDAVEVILSLTSDELDAVLKVACALSKENHRVRATKTSWYAPSLMIHDMDAHPVNRDENETKNYREYSSPVKVVSSPVGVSTMTDALKAAGVLIGG